MSEPKERGLSQVVGSLLSGFLPKIDLMMDGALHKTAENFNEMVEDNNRFLDRGKENLLQQTRDNGALNTTLLFSFALTEPVAKTLQATGNGLVDVLAFGEWEREGSAAGVFKDALRTMAVVDAGGGVRQLPRRLAPLVNRFVPGGATSCGLTSLAKGLNLSGQTITWSLDDIARGFGTTEAKAISPNFPGISPQAFQNIPSMLSKIGHEALPGRFRNPHAFDVVVSDLERSVLTTGDPHTFGLLWKNGGGHVMTGYSWRGKLHITDQFGTWVPEVVQGGGRRLLNIHPTPRGVTSKFLTIDGAGVSNALPTAFRLPGVTTVPRTVTLLDIAGHALLGADPSFVSLVPVSADALIRVTTGGGSNQKGNNGVNLPPFERLKKPKEAPLAIHTVAFGETLFGLAKRYYQDAAMFEKIIKHNGLTARPGNAILPTGMKLHIPK